MVSIIPAERTPSDVIGKMVYEQLSNNFPRGVQQGYERGQGLNAIDQLQQELKEANGDLSKMIPAMARAYTLNPSLERSGIADKLINLSQRKAGASDFPTGQSSSGSQGKVPQSVRDLVAPRESLVRDPQGTSQYQMPYGPEEIANIRQKSRELGYTPEMEDRFAKDAQEYNQIAQNRRDIELQTYNQNQQERRDTLENQKLFENYVTDHDPEFSKNPDELQLALEAGEKYQNEPSFAKRNAKVKEELRPYQAAKQALEKGLERPLLGRNSDQRDMLRKRAKYVVDKGQKPTLQLMIAKGGNGEVEEADLLNPLSPVFENQLKSMSKFIDPLSRVTSIDPDSADFDTQLSKGRQAREKQDKFMSDFLSKTIKPGKDYNEPGTNLLLTRHYLMEKGANWQEAGKLLDSAIEKGEIKLDPQQQIDYQKLAYPPLTGDTYLDTVMNNLMFPITGKQ